MLVLLASCALACSALAAQPAASAKRHSAAAKNGALSLKSTSVLVMDQEGKRVLYAKNEDAVVSIASITKLMTALVVLEAWMPPGELIAISKDDKDGLKGTGSRLQVGMKISRDDLLRLMLMAS